MSVCPACRHSSLCSWLCLQMANAELGLCSMPAPAPGQLFSTQTGKGMCFSVPTAGLLEKILPAPADFITSLPENPKSAGSQRGGEPGRGCRMAVLATGRDTPLGLWLLATAWVTSLSKVNWWHLCDFPLCSVLLPVRSLVEGFLLGLIALGEQVRKRTVCVMVLPGGLQLLRSQRGERLLGKGNLFQIPSPAWVSVWTLV